MPILVPNACILVKRSPFNAPPPMFQGVGT